MNEEKAIAIEVKNISKEFIINRSGDGAASESFWALKDISFTLYRGDVMGIIGSNGSGKTTLLKILSQITKPSSGEARFYGSSTSIIDIGNNFHPDLTGRENVTIQLRLENISRKEFNAYYDKIKDFSEIGDFFDQPVKFYSAGMFLRLAFSIAFHISADILILDEVLAVGDEGFRLKCQELLKTFTAMGKTILFVSHNRNEILELSNKCMWLEKGTLRKTGMPSEILGEYFAMHRDNFDAKKTIIDTDAHNVLKADAETGAVDLHWNEADAPGNDVLAIRSLSVKPTIPSAKLFHSNPIEIKFTIDKKKAGIQIGSFFFLQDVFYQPVLVGHFLNNTANQDFNNQLKNETGLVEIKCIIPANFLSPGKYYLLPRFGMEENEWSTTSTEAFRFSEELSFTLHPEPGFVDFIGDTSKGSVRPPLHWEIHKPNTKTS